MVVLIRISLVILAASVIGGREAWFTSRPLHVRHCLPDRAGIGLHLHLQPGIAGAAAWKQPRSVHGTGMVPNGVACYGPRRRGPRGPGPADHPGSALYLVHRSYSAQVWPRGRGCYLRMPAGPDEDNVGSGGLRWHHRSP